MAALCGGVEILRLLFPPRHLEGWMTLSLCRCEQWSSSGPSLGPGLSTAHTWKPHNYPKGEE